MTLMPVRVSASSRTGIAYIREPQNLSRGRDAFKRRFDAAIDTIWLEADDGRAA
jgi:hypothetical protein